MGQSKKEKAMTKTQVEEIAALQRSIFDQVTNRDRSKMAEQFETTLYWIRKQIWRQVQFVMLDCDDPVKAANFQTAEIKLGENEKATFYTCQATLIENQGEGGDENIRREAWLKYVRRVEELINREVSKKTGRYIKVRAKRKK